MKLSRVFGCFVVISTYLSGCDSSGTSITEQDSRPADSRPLSSTQINVFDNSIAAAKHAPLVAPLGSVNLFSNPGFESGLDGWNSCTGTPMTLSSDAYQGKQALEIMPDDCAYRSVQIEAGGTYILSCEVKLTSSKAWTGMGLVFANAAYKSLLNGPVAQATAGEYTTIVSKGTAPKGTSFVSMWVHSDHGALIDNCSLMLEEDRPAITPEDGNLLDNSDFVYIDMDVDGDVESWTSGCGGSVLSDDAGIRLLDGACLDQSLNVSAIESIKNSDVSFGCYIAESTGYSDLSVFLDGKLAATKPIPPTQGTTFVSVDVDAANASNGFVTLYSDGSLAAVTCTLDAEKSITPNKPDDGSTTTTPVVFGSTQLEEAVKQRLSITGRQVTRADMLELTDLFFFLEEEAADIATLTGLEYAVNLVSVGAVGSSIDSLSPLAGLTSLENVHFIGSNISDLSPLVTHTNLEILTVTSGKVSDISLLRNFQSLQRLWISTVPEFSDISVFAEGEFSQLERVAFSAGGLGNSSSSISDLSPLGRLNLESLKIQNGKVTDPSPVAHMSELSSLSLTGSPLTNLQSLVNGQALTQGFFQFNLSSEGLDLSENSPDLIALQAIERRGRPFPTFAVHLVSPTGVATACSICRTW